MKKPHTRPSIHLPLIKKGYSKGMSDIAIAKQIGTGRDNIRNIAKRNGIVRKEIKL